MSKLLVTVPLIAALLALAVACGDDTEEVAPGTNDNAGDNGSSSDSIEISAQDFEFSPSIIDATAGEEVSVTITNDGGAPHTFTIDDLDVDVEIAPGEEQTVSFTPTGDDSFYCRFHIGFDMEGDITTGEAASDSEDEPTPTEDPAGEFNY